MYFLESYVVLKGTEPQRVLSVHSSEELQFIDRTGIPSFLLL